MLGVVNHHVNTFLIAGRRDNEAEEIIGDKGEEAG